MWIWLLGFLVLIVKIIVILGVVMSIAAILTLVERRLLGFFQARLGPNRVGFFGLLQPLADGIKLILKEDIVPDAADRFIFLFAPMIVTATAILMFAVVPVAPDLTIAGYRIPMVISDINVGILYVFALSSLSVYGVALGGWASNSKFALIGGIRGAAQMISYELALGLSIVPIVMLSGSFSLVDIVNAQSHYPFILVQPVAFLIFLIASIAESKRTPFDLPEAETELGAGYNIEYSGMRFGMYFLGEYIHMQVLGAMIAVFFLGGWRGPFLPGPIWLLIKIISVCLAMIWIRATLPRFRYDQLMDMGWKIMVPVALINILITGLFII